MKKAVESCAIALLIAGPLVVSAATVMPAQGGLNNSSKPTNEAVPSTRSESAKSTVLVRNTTKAPERATAANAPEKPVATTKEPKHDKKTISRCWKRLMDMAREANMTHRKKKE